nr:SGNH/GDSL hydrolase family protein [Bacteroidota bacterium]
MTKKKLFTTIIGLCLLITINFAYAQKRIVVFGSSVAAGWVTSYQEKWDMQNGYAQRLQRMLTDDEVIINCVPGDNTTLALERMQDDVIAHKPDYCLIGLSMSNEGLGRNDDDEVYESYKNGLQKIISQCRENDIIPVVGLCYPNDAFSEKDYEYIKKMNHDISGWDVLSINFLGALDDGKGHFVEGHTFEGDHPDNRGHEEMMLAIPTEYFTIEGFDIDLQKSSDKNGIVLPGKKNKDGLTFIPEHIIHSFTISASFIPKGSSIIFNIQFQENNLSISVSGANVSVLLNNQNKLSAETALKAEKTRMTVSYNYLNKELNIYSDGDLLTSFPLFSVPLRFSLGQPMDGVKKEMGLNSSISCCTVQL